MRKIDYLLVLAFVLSPMNTLRMGKVGPAEILAVVWCVLAYLDARHPIVPGTFGRAWGVFCTIALAAGLHGVVVTPWGSHPLQIVTWLYLGVVSILAVAILRGRQPAEIQALLTSMGTAATMWFAALYVYASVVSSTLAGIPLWYGGWRFAGGADNPHQLSVVMAACVFICFRASLVVQKNFQKLIHLGFTALAIFIGYQTGSATFLFAVAVTAAVGAFYLLLDRARSRTGRAAIVVVAAMTVIIVLALQWKLLFSLVDRFMSSDENGWGRLTLWSSYADILDHTLVLGVGPGAYALHGAMEYHNSYLEFAAMLGLPAAAGLIVCFILLVRRLAQAHWSLMAIALSLFVYAIPGFAIRRLSFWLVIAVCLAIATVVSKHNDDSSEIRDLPGPRSRLRTKAH